MNSRFKRVLLSSCFFLCLASVMTRAQVEVDTIRWWNLATYSDKTIKNLAADTEHWQEGLKSGKLIRYANNVVTDGEPLKANSELIEELDGLLIGAGIEAGSLLLRHNMGSDNGVQMQRQAPVTIVGAKSGQTVVVTLKSSSKNTAGIASVTNMKGDHGEEHYTSTTWKTYTFDVTSDSNVSFTYGGQGIVIQSIGLLSVSEDMRPLADKPTITMDGNTVSLSCSTPGATIFYSIVDHGTVLDYAVEYTQPVTLDRSCRLRAVATHEEMQNSEVAELFVDIPLVMPFEGRPFVLDPEKLDRGAIATYSSSGVLVNWRWLIDEPVTQSYNVYRDGILLNTTPLTMKTNYFDNGGSTSSRYTIEVLRNGQSVETSEVINLTDGYLAIALDRPESGSNESGDYEYIPGDCMAGDVDGDGQYEIIMKWDPSNQQDNSIDGYTGNVLIDCYRLTGEKLWRIDLGKNIRAGAHYTQLMVYDLDGDGRAELACKTAPGTVDGQGKNVILEGDDPMVDYRNSKGHVISGPEYLTVFSGLTGEELATVNYTPKRDIIDYWGDSYGNRMERYLACVAYLDGERPSLVMCRGYYTAAYLWAVDFDGKNLKTRWLHSSDRGEYGAWGEGAHSLSVADVDGDLCDEIIYGACAIDNDGTLIYRTGLGHGDALHVGDHVPDRSGLEVMMVHEEISSKYGVEMHDALTGEIISGYFTGTDVGRGCCADVDANARGAEYWSTADGKVYDVYGKSIGTKRPSVNFRTYWDGDVLSEVNEESIISELKNRTSINTLVNFATRYSVGDNLIKNTPCLQADLFGDWREEVIYYDNTNKNRLMIFSTNHSSDIGVPTLMHDHQYRMATVWQTAAYNQPPHLSYFLPDYVETLKKEASSVGIAEAGKEVKGIRFFNLLGQQTSVPEGKIYFLETEYTDGSFIREKRFAGE